MQPYSLPEIAESDLKAAREFLTSIREEERRARALHLPAAPHDGVAVRNGISRARLRSAAKTGS